MKKDIFDIKLGESKRFDRAQVFFTIVKFREEQRLATS